MSDVGVVLRLRPGLSDVFHDFVLPFSRHIVAGEDHLAFPPVRILANLLVHEILELFRELSHEHSTYRNQIQRQAMRGYANTWGDAIAVESLSLREFPPLSLSLLPDFSSLLGCSEPSTPLLVHLRTRGDPIDSHEKQLLRFDLSK